MDKTVIPIKKSSIKRNPNAGRTEHTEYTGHWTLTGTYRGEIPKWMKEYVFVHSWATENGVVTESEFQNIKPIDSNFIEKVKLDNKATIEMHNQLITYYSATPEPNYLFEYSNPLVECESCHSKVRFKDIESGYVYDSDGEEHNADECPVCNKLNSFNYRYENIEEAIKKP